MKLQIVISQAAWDAVVDKYASENRIGGINLDNLNEKERALKIQEIKDGFKGVKFWSFIFVFFL